MADEDKNLLGIKFGNDKWKCAHATTRMIMERDNSARENLIDKR